MQDVSHLEDTASHVIHVRLSQVFPALLQMYLIGGQDAVEAVQQDLQPHRNRLSSIENQGAQVQHWPRQGHLHWAAARQLLSLKVELLHS